MKNTLTLTAFLLSFTVQLKAQYIAIARLDNVKIRSCPSLNCAIIGQLAIGEEISFMPTAKHTTIEGYGHNSWFQINYNGRTGFIYGAVMILQTNHLQKKLTDFQSSAYVRTSKINVRTCPSENCPKIFQIPQGHYFKILSRTKSKNKIQHLGNGHWWLISYKKN